MRKILGGNRPDITPAQVIAGIPVIAALLRAFGVYDLSKEEEDALNATVIWALGLVGFDAVLRVGRAHADAKVKAAALTGAPLDNALPPDSRHPIEVALTPEEIAAELGRAEADPTGDATPALAGLPTDAEEDAFPPPAGD